MIPQVRYGDNRAEVSSGENIEVPDTHAEARQNTMQRLVDPIKGPEHNRFYPAAPFGKDRVLATFITEGADEFYGACRRVLSIGIHY